MAQSLGLGARAQGRIREIVEFYGSSKARGKHRARQVPLSNGQRAFDLNRYLSIPRRLIFESSVRVGIPSLAAAPSSPDT